MTDLLGTTPGRRVVPFATLPVEDGIIETNTRQTTERKKEKKTEVGEGRTNENENAMVDKSGILVAMLSTLTNPGGSGAWRHAIFANKGM